MGVTGFRRGTLQDAGAITALIHAAFAPWVPVMGREPLPMTVDYTQAVQAHQIDLFYQDGTLVALIEMVPEVDHLWIETIAVAPGQQGRGIGLMLIAHAEEVARTLKKPELRLLTNAALVTNLRFYVNRGFAEERREPFRGGTVVYFRKTLRR